MKDEELKKICQDVLDVFPDKVNNYKLGKTSLLGLFVGEAMKKSKGLAEPKQLNRIMKELLN